MSEDKKKSAAINKNPRAAMVARAVNAIYKKTNQKPLRASASTLPHVSTGSFGIDMLIGGTPTLDGKGLICPGIPRRRITEIYGPESSGKTTLLISTMVQAQKAGGACMFIDFEHSLDHGYAKKLGLSYDDDKLAVFQPDTMEEGLNMIFIGIVTGFDVIGVDSVAAMVLKDELEKGFEDAARIGAVARMMAGQLPKLVLWLQKHPVDKNTKSTIPDHPGTALIFINQTRALIQSGYGGGGGDNENTSGGKALKFFAYLRLRASKIKAEVVERPDMMTGKKRRFPYGNVTDIKVVKSKIDAKQGHSTQCFIRFGAGIDDYFSLIETAVVHKLAKREGAYYVLGDQRFQGKEKFRQFLIANPRVYEALRTKLVQCVNATAITIVDELSDEDSILEAIGDDDDVIAGDEISGDVEEVVESADTEPLAASEETK